MGEVRLFFRHCPVKGPDDAVNDSRKAFGDP